MQEYGVVSPRDEEDLKEAIGKAKNLANLVLHLTVRKDTNGDELAARRGDEHQDIKVKFVPAIMYFEPPISLIGEATMDNGMPVTARLRVTGSDDNDGKNVLILDIVE